ncbi:MAG: type II secretion system F family protein [Caldilineaceae bacterium]|nr:type II secretion system F family protein [Caldilineaceae bacterium]
MEMILEQLMAILQMGIATLQRNETRMVLVAVLIGLACFLVGFGLFREYQHQELQRRLRKLAESTHQGELETESESFNQRILKPMGHSLLAVLGRLTPGSNLELLRRQLLLAGNPHNLAVIDLLGMKMLAGIVLGLLTGFYLFNVTQLPSFSAIMFSIVGGGVGLYIPNYWLKNQISKRQEEIMKALPNALDMLTTMVDAGLGFDMAMLRLSDRWHNALTQEFERTVNEMNMGVRRSDALRNMAERNDVAELRSFVAVLVQADSLGISIADILHTQSAQMRMRRRQRAEEKANKMPLKMLPIITIFIFPALFAIILGPAIPLIMESMANF